MYLLDYNLLHSADQQCPNLYFPRTVYYEYNSRIWIAKVSDTTNLSERNKREAISIMYDVTKEEISAGQDTRELGMSQDSHY